ncbi:MAG: hypothetical protein HWQ38_09115 [Nostoc sp. NMS7]|nr:hypothetical protein [Nostoc sp. NMS7]MBN3946634.1 hypothetical protein [Nostoc sp. NMS7]
MIRKTSAWKISARFGRISFLIARWATPRRRRSHFMISRRILALNQNRK